MIRGTIKGDKKGGRHRRDRHYHRPSCDLKDDDCFASCANPLNWIGGKYAKALGKMGRGKGKPRTNKTEPVKDASGLHTTWKTNPDTGQITRHETWTPNPQNPSGWDSKQSTDLTGRAYTNKQTGERVPTPHTQGRDIPGGVRPASPNGIPRR